MESKQILTGIAAAAAALVVGACSQSEAPAPALSGSDLDAAPAVVDDSAGQSASEDADLLVVDEQSGSTSVDAGALDAVMAAMPTGSLSADETASLLYMREEEKLAHDVYITLGAQWRVQVFQNIASSEQTHADAVQVLLDRYAIADPTLGKGLGEFSDPTLQALYHDLIAQGQTSLESALRAGAAVEEIDILDLEQRITQTDNADIMRVYGNLLTGSRNHLRAFASTLDRQVGVTYTPRYLSAESYNAILSAGFERGRNGRGG